MGYDFDLVEHFKPCKHCGRSDSGRSESLYTSWNHGWAFYEYLDKKKGLRWLYGKTGIRTRERLETMLECLEQLNGWKINCDTNPEIGDGWNNVELAVGNAHYFAKHILETAKKLPKGTWGGD